MNKKKTILSGLSIAVVFLVFMTGAASGQHSMVGETLYSVLEYTLEDLGCTYTGFVKHDDNMYTDGPVITPDESWYVKSAKCAQCPADERWGFNCDLYSTNWYRLKDDSPWNYEGKNMSSYDNDITWTEFHGHKAVWIISDQSYKYHAKSVQLYWLIEPYEFHIYTIFREGEGPGYNQPKQTVLKFAEVMYSNLIKCGIIEGSELPDCLTATTVQNVNVMYPDGTEMMCKDPTTMELAEGMTFKAIDQNSKAVVRLPNKIIYDLEEVKINLLQTTNESSDIAYDAKMKPSGMSWTIDDEMPSSGIIQAVPKDISFLTKVYGERITTSRTELYSRIAITEVVENAIIYIATTSTPLAVPAAIYKALDTAQEITNAIIWDCEHNPIHHSERLDPIGDYYKTPRDSKGAIMTPLGQVLHNSAGIISITNNKIEVYVFEGEFQLSDPDETKTVTVYANQTSSCKLNSVPTVPKPFDRRSINKILETINKSGDTIKDKHITESWTDDGSGCWKTSNGLHTMTGNSKETVARCLYGKQELCNFTFQADMRKTSGDNPDINTYGLYFRGDGTTKNYYSFTITADGRYLVAKKVKGLYTEITGATHSDSLKSGHNEWNTLSVNVEGLRTTFYINGDHTAEIVDGSFVRGKVALFAIDSSTSNTPDIVQFRNIQVTEIYETTPSITPDIEILRPDLRDSVYVVPVP